MCIVPARDVNFITQEVLDHPMETFRESIDPEFPGSLTSDELDDLIRRLNGRISANHHTCPSCGSSDTVRKGFTSSGAQRCLCKQCARTFVRDSPGAFSNSHLDGDVWRTFCRTYLEGGTMRRCSEVCNVCLKTASRMKSRLIEDMRLSDGFQGVFFHGEMYLEAI